MNVGKESLFAAIILALAGCQSPTQEPRTLAKQIVQQSQFDRSIVEYNVKFSSSVFKNQFIGILENADPEITNAKLSEFHEVIDNHYNRGAEEVSGPTKNLLIDFYVDNFSEEELSALIDLHRSPVLQKQLSLLPDVMQKSDELYANWQLQSQWQLIEHFKKQDKKEGE